MKKELVTLIFLLTITSFATAEIIIETQPDETYNMGDSAEIAMTIKALNPSTGTFTMELICAGLVTQFYQNGIDLDSGEEKTVEASLILKEEIIGDAQGTCKIKGIFEEEYIITNDFYLSKRIDITLDEQEWFFSPLEEAIIEGQAARENGEPSNGFIYVEMAQGEGSPVITKTETINNGFFSINLNLPEDLKAGFYTLKFEAYEGEESSRTNEGFLTQAIEIKQIPKNLEIITEEGVIPGENAQIRIILHDQTGENIETSVIIKIFDHEETLLEQLEKITNELYEYHIAYNQAPTTWEIVTEYNDLFSEKKFKILEKKDVDISIANNTVTITNVGNVVYNESISIKIGNETIPVKLNLDIDESQEYILKAPEGLYDVRVLKKNGDEYNVQGLPLTGKVIKATEKGGRSILPFAWIFILLILGVATRVYFKKRKKKTFLGRMPNFKNKKKAQMAMAPQMEAPVKQTKFHAKNPGFVSLSIKGEKQKATTTCLKIKNLEEVEKSNTNAKETIQKVIDFAEENKAIVYENQNHLNFILAPVKTRTFKNEITALQIARGAKKMIDEHNKLYKQKINFGISINNGNIIAKPESHSTKFMSMGTFITTSKKNSEKSDGSIFFTKDISEATRSQIKSEPVKGHEEVYKIKEIKTYSEENKKFIEDFVRRLNSQKK